MKEAKQLVSDNFEGWAVSKEIDFIVVDDPWEPFEDHPDFVTARILLEIALVDPEDCKQLLMSLAGKVVGLGRRRIEQVSSSEWDLLMTVEAESIARLSDFISNSLKEQVIVKRTQTFVASQMTMWDRDRGTQYPNQKPSGPPAPGKFINAVVFTRARHGRNVNISGTVGDISASGATAIRVLPCPEADIVVEYRADDRWGLQRFVYDSLGKRNDVDGTETSILIPNSLDDKSPFPAPESPRSAYCRIMAPSKEHNKLSAALEKIEGVVMARGCFGAYDVLAILDVANFTEYEETLDRINKVKGVERVDVLLSRDFLDRQ
jgi:DNA-binding Lrp family transcriptional regulator